MKYHLFGGNFFYARGGVNNFVKTSTSLEELQQLAYQKLSDKEDYCQWYYICDENMNIIEQSADQAHF